MSEKTSATYDEMFRKVRSYKRSFALCKNPNNLPVNLIRPVNIVVKFLSKTKGLIESVSL